ncbi:hypothetical protein [Aestuariimicrobium kwangyangense]|uniref:hypothetical protein n=1 Tax=Aestuariimicrobium kwangyangense TaxID=396389 RepID=UPI0003B43027|nr:hypothetical protein [Aestuariimicrobium kwangyangense]
MSHFPPPDQFPPPEQVSSWAPPAPLPAVRRFRDWCFAVAVLTVAAVLCTGWAVWVETRTGTYPVGVQQGGTFTDQTTGMELSVLSWRVSRWLPDGDKVQVAPQGMVYLTVVARWRSVGGEGGCSLDVVGRGQETWDETEYVDDLPYSCTSEERALGSGVVYQNFVLPEAKLGEVRGVRAPQSMRGNQGPLLRPPA